MKLSCEVLKEEEKKFFEAKAVPNIDLLHSLHYLREWIEEKKKLCLNFIEYFVEFFIFTLNSTNPKSFQLFRLKYSRMISFYTIKIFPVMNVKYSLMTKNEFWMSVYEMWKQTNSLTWNEIKVHYPTHTHTHMHFHGI